MERPDAAGGGGARCVAGRRSLLPSRVRSWVLQPGLRAGAVGLPLSPRPPPEAAGVRRCLLAAGERWPPRLRARVRAGARGARGRSPVFAHRLRSLLRAVSVQHWRRAGSGSRQRRQRPAAQVLRDGDCPSMIIPSRPRVSEETSPDVRAQEYLSLT
ncbi:uncharacterized protein ACIB01_001542 [Guaruba guarouba]